MTNYMHGGNLGLAESKYGLHPDQFLDFSANINPYGPSPAVLRRLEENLPLIRQYPDPDCRKLRLAIAHHLGISPELVLPGNGASELIYLAARVFNWQSALIPQPTFSEYGLAVKAAGGRVRELIAGRKEGFAPSFAAVAQALPGADVLFLCNPNNPTGHLTGQKALAEILTLSAGCGAAVVVDEAFLDFVPGRDQYTALNFINEYPNLILLYSLTKILAVPGLRLGALNAGREIVSRLQAARDPWSVNLLAQEAGVAGLADREFLRSSVEQLTLSRENLRQALLNIPGLKPLPGRANFLLVDISGTAFTSTELADKLGHKGILVRDCHNFPGLGREYIRVAVRTEAENAMLVITLQSVLQ